MKRRLNPFILSPKLPLGEPSRILSRLQISSNVELMISRVLGMLSSFEDIK
jgi:hypothetical protein